MKKILMVVYNTIQNDARVIRAAEALSKSNYEVTVLSCNSDINYTNKYFKSEVYSKNINGPKLLIAFWIYVLRYLQKNSKNYDILYMHDYFMPIIGRIHSLFSNKKWIYDAHELLIQRKNHNLSVREKLFLFLEKISIKNADLVIAANNERLKIIRNIYKLNNCISVSNISDLDVKKNSNPKNNTIVYQGILNSERRVDLFIKVLTYLPSNINLKLIGGGQIDFYRKLAKQLGVEDRVIFTGRIPYSQLMKESQECKVGIIIYRMDDLNNLYCSPNKLYEYIQFGLPIITSPQPFLVDVIRKYKIGEVWDIREGNIQDLAQKIELIMNNQNKYTLHMEQFNCDYNNKNEMAKLVKAINIL